MRRYLIPLLIILVAFLFTACEVGGPPDSSSAVPSGDPDFPPFQGNWVIDTTNSIPKETIAQASAVLQKLRDDGLAETVIVIVKGVNHPETWTTHYGRAIKLGNAETDNGLVWLIRPDAGKDEHIVYSVGRGLPKFTSSKVTEASKEASDLANQGKYVEAVTALAKGTDRILRDVYKATETPSGGEKEGEEEEEKLTPEQQRAVLIGLGILVGFIVIVGIILTIIDPELGAQWFLFWLRIFLIALASAGSKSKTGGSGKFGGRSGTR